MSTSTNAVRAVWEKFAEFGLDARRSPALKTACVGQATAEKVRSFGIVPELVGPSLTEWSSPRRRAWTVDLPAVRRRARPLVDRVLLPRADIATDAGRRAARARLGRSTT